MDNKKMVKDTYNAISKQYFDTYYEDLGDIPFYEKFRSLLKENASILDLGCGNGKTSKYFSQFGYQILGLDFSENMLNFAKEHNPQLKFQLQDITDFSFQQKFDGAIYAYSLFHLNKEQAENSIFCTSKQLNKDAPLLLLLQKCKGEIIEPEPFNPNLKIYCKLYTEEEITNLLKKYGFQIKEVFSFCEDEDNALSNETMCVLAIKE